MADNIAADEVRLLIERIETVESEIEDKKDDRKDIYLEAKSRGYNTKILRAIVAIRKMDPDKRKEYEAELETYMGALGIR